MYYFIMVLIVIVCLLLVGIVMIQNSKGGGLASDFSSSNQIVGVKRTGDFLEKATWGLAIMLIGFSLASNFFIDREVVEEGSAIQTQVDDAPAAEPAVDFPAGGEAPPAQ